MKIVLVKRHWFPWKSSAGEICFLQFPMLGPFWQGRQWHPFSLAYSNSNDVKAYNDSIEFLIQIQRNGSWTHSLKQILFDESNLLTKPAKFFIRGPFGSSFGNYRDNEVLMLIGGGSGIASSLSVLRELCKFRGNVKRCWFIFAARNFSSVQWTWKAIDEVLHPTDALHSTNGFIRISIHVSARLTTAQEMFVKHNGALKYIYRPGRPDWKKLFRSFSAQSIGGSGPKKVKICACANKAIYADINKALVEVNNPNLRPEFSSENFE
jgi:predicted ferric reductase